jgi:hypothetical protein
MIALGFGLAFRTFGGRLRLASILAWRFACSAARDLRGVGVARLA